MTPIEMKKHTGLPDSSTPNCITGSKNVAYNTTESGLSQFNYADSSREEMVALVPIDAKKVLDVGCHLGAFGRAIKIRGKIEVWGVEPNPQSAAIARKSLDRVINGPFGSDLNIPNNYFDIVTFNDVLEHMVDPWAAVELASRKLTKGGSLIVSIPNVRHIDNLLHILVEKDFNYEPFGIRDRTHLRFFTKKSCLRLFDQTGLEVTKIVGINEDWWRPTLVRRIAFRVFNRYLEETKYMQFAVVARKLL